MTQAHALAATPFIGRARELADVSERLATKECRLLTLTGLGGCGKTRLAIEAAGAAATYFPDGTVFVPLQPIPRGDLLLSAIAQAVGLILYSEDAPHEQLFAHLRVKRLLLILDNFEHLLDGAPLVSALLAAAPGLKILATSREALHLQEEWLYPLQGLATPASVYATSLESYEAVQLFLSHARRAQPTFELAGEHEAVLRICKLTAGLPLAIELATSWLRGLPAAQIAQAIQRSLDILSTNARNVEDRHRSMRAVFDQSWALLSVDERRIFSWLSVFRGGFDHEAAAHVAGASLADLAALAEKSLTQFDASGRFNLHELLHQYGAEQLEVAGEATEAQARHAQYFAELMQRQEAILKQPEQLAAMQVIDRDFENVRRAWDWSVAHGHADNLHQMLNALYLFGFLGSRHVETIRIFQQTLAGPVADACLLGRLLARRWGSLHWWLQSDADYQEALVGIERALAIAEAERDDFEAAFCHLMASYALMGLRRAVEALPHLEKGKAIFESLDEPFYTCWALSRMGYLYADVNRPDQAIRFLEQSLLLARTMHNRFGLVSCLYNLGSDYILNGDYITGGQYGAEVTQLASETGHVCQMAHGLSLVALNAFYRGDHRASHQYVERSLDAIKDILRLTVQPYSLALCILLACLDERYAEAVQISAISKWHSMNAMGAQLNCWARAALACGLGHRDDARATISSALHMAVDGGHPAAFAGLAPCAAYLLAETEPAMAAELLAWALTDPDSALEWARRWPLVGRLCVQIQARLGSDPYAASWERGRTLGLEDIRSTLHRAFAVDTAASNTAAANGHQQLLTGREREILSLMAAGKTNPQIADQLIIGAGTVKTHTLNIYRKLEVANRTQAIVRAQELGLLP